MSAFGSYMLVGGVAAATTFVVTPLMRWLSPKIGGVVPPDPTRVHTKPTPTLGGVAMFVGFLAAMLVAWQLDAFKEIFSSDNSEPLGVVIGAALMFAVGLLDDLYEWSAPAKLSGMIFAASPLFMLGVEMFYFRVPFFDLVVLSNDLQPLVTVLWVIGMANAINLIDGLDGLAAGIVAIAAATFFFYGDRLVDLSLLDATTIGPLLAIIVVGLCVGFLPHNFNPARIFMGDCGALLLGLLMACSTIVVGGRVNEPFSGQTYFFFAPLFIPLVILGVPMVDTLFAIVRRATRRSGLATRDKDHLHHRLMRLGHGQRRSVLILWLWTAILSGFVLYPTYTGKGDAVVPLGIAAMFLVLYTVLHPQVRRVRAEGE
ncbi:MAG: glycosyltransferase family 4 protein [Acidimicrobiia bacterium]